MKIKTLVVATLAAAALSIIAIAPAQASGPGTAATYKGRVFHDLNDNGVHDSTDHYAAGFTVRVAWSPSLTSPTFTWVGSAVSDSVGNFTLRFATTLVGVYVLYANGGGNEYAYECAPGANPQPSQTYQCGWVATA